MATRGDVELIYGESNVKKWADINNDGNTAAISSRVTWALDLASARIEDSLRDGPYEIPFSTDPTQIVDIKARLAGVILYESRGITDAADSEHQLLPHKREVDKIIREIHGNRITFSGVKRKVNVPKAGDGSTTSS